MSWTSVVVLRLGRQDRGTVIQVVCALSEAMRRGSPAGKLWIVDERRLRIHEGR